MHFMMITPKHQDLNQKKTHERSRFRFIEKLLHLKVEHDFPFKTKNDIKYLSIFESRNMTFCLKKDDIKYLSLKVHSCY